MAATRATITRFRVKLYGFRCENLPAMDRGGTSDPYLTVDFDHYKTFETSVKKKNRSPVWDEEVEFLYETKLAHKLAQKRMRIKCNEKDRFSSDRLIGRVYIDLYALATGPVEYRLPLRDGQKVTGEITFNCEMVEVCALEINLRNVEIDLPPQLDEVYGEQVSDYYIEFGYDGDPDWEKRTRKSPQGRTQFNYLDALYASTTYEEMLDHHVIFLFKKRVSFGSDELIGRAFLRLRNCFSFTDGLSQQFSLSLELERDFIHSHSFLAPQPGTLAGDVFFTNAPQFVQMKSGYFTDNGIFHSCFAHPDVPNKPKVHIHAAASARPTPSHQALMLARGQQQQQQQQQYQHAYAIKSSAPPSAAPYQYASHPIGASHHPPNHGGPGPRGGMAPYMAAAPAAQSAQPRVGGPAYLVGNSQGGRDHSSLASAPPADDAHGPSKGSVSALSDDSRRAESGTTGGGGEEPESSSYTQKHATRPSSTDAISTDDIAAAEEHRRVGDDGADPNDDDDDGTSAGGSATAHHGGSKTILKDDLGLPWFWERSKDPSSGRYYFKNHAYKGTEWSLPTEPTYTVAIIHPGPLGLELEKNYSGEARFGPGKKSGRRFSAHDVGAVVASAVPRGQADKASGGRIRKGHHLVAINGLSALQYDFGTCLQMLVRTPRPIRLTFADPYAVPPAVAMRASRDAVPSSGNPSPVAGKLAAAAQATRFTAATHSAVQRSQLSFTTPQASSMPSYLAVNAGGAAGAHHHPSQQQAPPAVAGGGGGPSWMARGGQPHPHHAAAAMSHPPAPVAHPAAAVRTSYLTSSSQGVPTAPAVVDESAGQWRMEQDAQGNVCYRNSASGRVSYSWPPK